MPTVLETAAPEAPDRMPFAAATQRPWPDEARRLVAATGRDGFAAHEPAVVALGAHLGALGIAPVLAGILADRGTAHSMRERALVRVVRVARASAGR